jgi:signal transduction histidine kinase
VTQTARLLIVVVVLLGLYSCPELPVVVPAALGFVAGIAGTVTNGTSKSHYLDVGLFALGLVVVTVTWRLFDRRDKEAARVASWLRDRADTIVDLMPEPVVLTDGVGHVLRWNPVCGSALGLHEGDHAHCAAALGLHVGERSLDCAAGCALLSLVGTGADRSVEVWRPLPDGQRQPLLASVTPVLDPQGRLSEVVHCFRDITRLKEADEAKTLFLATASHELKTPLTVIRGFGEMLHSGRLTDPEAQARAFEAIHLRSIELARVVDRLLLSSRIDAGRLSVKLDRVGLADVVRARAESLEASTHRPVTVAVVGEPGPAWADVTALTTVVDHLLDNAVKYSPDGQSVDVIVRSAPSAVALEVTDHGIGMTAEQAEHCFDKFWQADRGDRRRFGGTGIGLYIVRSLVESMGGQIDVTSSPGHGTTFIVAFANAEQAAVPAQRSGAAPAAPERSIIREFMRQIGVPGEGRG